MISIEQRRANKRTSYANHRTARSAACNFMLGAVNDSSGTLRAAAQYLEEHNG